jgi:multimeric flavodoxin WrbA
MQKSETIIIFGSSRSHGDTRKLVDFICEQAGFDFIDLNDFKISYYDYNHQNLGDDFLPLMQRIVGQYRRIIFATPIYWYTMSAVMKTFFDRLSDLLTVRKELGRQLRGKAMGVVSVSGHDDLDYDFENPFRKSADYLGMTYLGHFHVVVENETMTATSRKRLLEWVKNRVTS